MLPSFEFKTFALDLFLYALSLILGFCKYFIQLKDGKSEISAPEVTFLFSFFNVCLEDFAESECLRYSFSVFIFFLIYCH